MTDEIKNYNELTDFRGVVCCSEITADMLEFLVLYERIEDLHRKMQALNKTFTLEQKNILNNKYLKPKEKT